MANLSEYSTITIDLSRGQAESLRRTGFVDVGPAPGGHWEVTATSYVGSLVVDGVELLVRPKINAENLFLLLEPGLPPSAWLREAYEYEASGDLLPSVIAFFARTVETTLGRGVLRAYHGREEALVALRGRPDIVGQFKRAGMLTPVACRYDDFSEDVLENRVLRAAVRLALRVPRVDPEDRQRLTRQLAALDNVADVSVRAETFDSVHITRLNQHYSPALGLARLVLANLTLSDARGSTTASSFMVDMNDLFQRFVTERLRRELRGRLDVVAEPTVHLGVGREVPMQPDLVFRSPETGEVRFVADLKYKLAHNARGSSADHYQLLAYTTALNLPDGMLIYCRRPDERRRRTVTVRNAGKNLTLTAIDLSGRPDQVEEEISRLADAIAGGVTA
ncbi:McrC family protein [Gordonia metallireducens]|uniref:McrC family protein n=1 Tax=Gordonia metallireducens TaxID=2897779 RepID=UPI001E5CCC9F|nr:McrC family protein [Gordonia metallireducens]